ncbi:LysR substrate-binding domain-containing protein [Paenibacillus sp. JTLBN-2024]
MSVRLQTGRETHILKQVKEGELDLGLILDGEPSDPSLAWQTIRDEPSCCWQARSIPFAG